LAADDLESLVDEVMAHARERLEPEMRAVDPTARIVFEEISEFPGLETPASREVVGLAKRLAGRNEHGKVAYGTETGLFALPGTRTGVCGPGSNTQAQRADEYIAVSQSKACAAFLAGLLGYPRPKFGVM